MALGLCVTLCEDFRTAAALAALLQVPQDEAEESLDVLATCTVDDEPLIRSTAGGTWLLAQGVIRRATGDARSLEQAQRRGLLGWYRPAQQAAEHLVCT